MNRQAFVYALTDPITKAVHYVGCSVHPRVRLLQHYVDARRVMEIGSCHKSPPAPRSWWIAQLIQQNLKPELTILERCNFEDGLIREDFWIEHYLIMGCRLTNVHRMNNSWALNKDYYEKNRAAKDAAMPEGCKGMWAIKFHYEFIPFEL